MNNKTAVILLNLGGPDSLKAVRPFLTNLFSDPDIFKFPMGWLTQKFFAWMIAYRRAAIASKNYAAIGGRSPILEHTREQAIALQLSLAMEGDYDVFVCMRYWHPMTKEVVRELKQKAYKNVILLPLYPQYSITTTGSSVNEFFRVCKKQSYFPKIKIINEWFNNELYLQAIVMDIKTALRSLPNPDPDNTELLFSAHGLPKKLVDQGDVYQQQIEATVAAVNQRLQWPNTTLCYQSRVGPLEWLQPYISEVIVNKAGQGCKQMLVYPIAFVSDHVETLYELGIEYAKLAADSGIENYKVVPALNDHPELIEALKELVVEAQKSDH